MKMPPAARPRFDRLLTEPLQKATAHKRAARALLDSLEAADAPQAAPAAVRLVAALLDRMERKTSPLYVRLTHAAVRFVTEDLPDDIGQADWELRREVAWSVAHSTKHFDLVGANP